MRTRIEGPLADTVAGATAEAVLKACVHCGMCNATCPTYALTGDELDGPRGRIYLMMAALEGQPVSRLTQVHLDRCLSCRACETTCPSGVAYHRLYDVARPEVDRQVARPWRERLARGTARAAGRWSGLIAPVFAVRRALLPKLVRRSHPEPAKPALLRTMALLKGCVQANAAPGFNKATKRVFAACGIALEETPSVGCCGALDFHNGDPARARLLARRNIEAWSAALDQRAEAIVVNASGCAAFIKDYPDVFADEPATQDKAARIAGAVRDPVEVLRSGDLPVHRTPRRPRIAVHDPCTLRNGAKLGGAVASLLRGMGYDPQPVEAPHMCCGSAGAYSLLQPGMARDLRRRKLLTLEESHPSAIYTANIGCWMHLGSASKTPVRHWIEAVDDLL